MNQQCPAGVSPGEQLARRGLMQVHDFELYDDRHFSHFQFNSLQPRNHAFEPVQVQAYHVCFRGVTFDLTNCELTLKLFQLFASAKNYRCNLTDILKNVYGLSLRAQQSPRYRRSARMRAIKLISRARRLAAEAFADVTGDKTEWFTYDHDAKSWTLYENRDRCIYLQ